MHDQIEKFQAKMRSDAAAVATTIAFAVRDDRLITDGVAELATLAAAILEQLDAAALLIAAPATPFVELLLDRDPSASALIPRDTETRTFLHDIPLIRQTHWQEGGVKVIAEQLAHRKGVVVEGIGIIAVGPLTVEQAYIFWSSVYHATYVGYLYDLLCHGYLLPGERDVMAEWQQSLPPLTDAGLIFASCLESSTEILSEMERVGRYTVTQGLVDSFFGNISCTLGNILHISQTGASLDALAGLIDPVPFDNSSTCGITASSELAAHRRIVEVTGCRTILHGHPRFSVIMSMLCEVEGCPITDCWRDCDRVRLLGGTPVVAGEIGAGGLAKRVPPVIGQTGAAIVFGHGVFAIGSGDFATPFRALLQVEQWCRTEYFRCLHQRWQ
ncbi:MAG TPA: class II aldolase/adducin family protein [Geobacterales bacterium]|nr:class II aldolase/adducin family protein [Geobacterales bacterium]